MKSDIWIFFENLSRKIQVSLKSDKNNGYFTRRPVYIFDHISLSFLFFFFTNSAVYEIMWKNTVEPDSPQMTIWRVRNACWITKATNTLWIYCLLVHCSNGYTNEPPCYVIRALPVLLTIIAHSYTYYRYLHMFLSVYIMHFIIQYRTTKRTFSKLMF